MTLTFNRETYASLLSKYQPQVIKTEQENKQAIALAQELAHQAHRTSEESALFDLLIALIEKYEDEHYPMGDSNPNSMLLHLMEAQNLKDTDLVKIIGSSSIISEIINGKQEISKPQAKALGEFFHVEPELFL